MRSASGVRCGQCPNAWLAVGSRRLPGRAREALTLAVGTRAVRARPARGFYRREITAFDAEQEEVAPTHTTNGLKFSLSRCAFQRCVRKSSRTGCAMARRP